MEKKEERKLKAEKILEFFKENKKEMLLLAGGSALSIISIVYCVLTRRKISNASENSFLSVVYENDEAFAKTSKDVLKHFVKNTKFWDENYDSMLTLTTLDKLGTFGEKLVERFEDTTLDTTIALFACTEAGFKEKK